MSRGFTLLELIVSIAIFGIIAVVAAQIIGQAGDNRAILHDSHESYMHLFDVSRQLRMDIYAASDDVSGTDMLEVLHDQRGGVNYDTLNLLVREAGQADLTRVQYQLIDQGDISVLQRVSSPLLSDSSEQMIEWNIGELKSFNVEVQDRTETWHLDWKNNNPNLQARAIRITWIDQQDVEREMLVPIWLQRVF